MGVIKLLVFFLFQAPARFLWGRGNSGTGMTGRPGHRAMEMNGRSTVSYLVCTPRVPLFMLVLIGPETKNLLAFQGRRGIASVVRWNPRPVIFGVEKHINKFPRKSRGNTCLCGWLFGVLSLPNIRIMPIVVVIFLHALFLLVFYCTFFFISHIHCYLLDLHLFLLPLDHHHHLLLYLRHPHCHYHHHYHHHHLLLLLLLLRLLSFSSAAPSLRP